jgi:hypothetical protein
MIRKQVYVTYNSVIKEPTLYQGAPLPSNYHWFPAMAQNLGSHKIKNDCEGETVVTMWGNMGHKLLPTGNRKADPTIREMPQLWQRLSEKH